MSSVIERLRSETRFSKGTLNLFGISGGKDSSALLLWALFESNYQKESLRFTFCDTGNEHEWTYEHVILLNDLSLSHGGPQIEWLKPKRDFWELAFHKHRFPSARARFCTQELKIFPTQDWIEEKTKEGYSVLSHSGVRADESFDRAQLLERDLNGHLCCEEYRPLLKWKWADVIALHKIHDVPMNKLYAAGAKRVGCFPCIMSRKAEIRNIALNFPERIDIIVKNEQRFLAEYGRYSSFFVAEKAPKRFRSKECTAKDGSVHKFATIEDIVAWSMTGKRAKGSWEDDEIQELHTCESGFCE